MRMTIMALILLLAVATVSAQTPKFGVGAFAGFSLPVAQDDQGSGTEFGFRGRLKLSFLTVEPNFTIAKWGEGDLISGVTAMPDGSKVTSFGIDALLGGAPGVPGFKPFFVIGAGSYKVKNDDTQFEETALGFSGGLGFLIGLSPKFDRDARGKAVVIPMEDGGSKKALSVTAGLAMNF